MSIRVMNWVWQHSPAKGTELLLLLAIADAADDQGGNAFPSVNTLARKTRMSRRTVQRLVTQLEAQGLIKVRQAGGRESNRYTVLMSTTQVGTPPPETLSTDVASGLSYGHQKPHQSHVESTRGVKMTPRQSVTGDKAMTRQGRQGCDTPGVTEPCHPTRPVSVLYPTTASIDPEFGAGRSEGGGGDVTLEPDARQLLQDLGPNWRLGAKAIDRLTPAVVQALQAGWGTSELIAHLGASPEGVRSPYAVLKTRLDDLPEPSPAAPRRPIWCGTCHEQTRLIDTADGAMRCPDCHPGAAAAL